MGFTMAGGESEVNCWLDRLLYKTGMGESVWLLEDIAVLGLQC